MLDQGGLSRISPSVCSFCQAFVVFARLAFRHIPSSGAERGKIGSGFPPELIFLLHFQATERARALFFRGAWQGRSQAPTVIKRVDQISRKSERQRLCIFFGGATGMNTIFMTRLLWYNCNITTRSPCFGAAVLRDCRHHERASGAAPLWFWHVSPSRNQHCDCITGVHHATLADDDRAPTRSRPGCWCGA